MSEQQKEKPKCYMTFNLERDGNIITFSPQNVVSMEDRSCGAAWDINPMYDFLYGKENKIKDYGMALGIQNVICYHKDNEFHLLAGLRMKVQRSDKLSIPIDADKPAIAFGCFNTGYKLIRDQQDLIDPLQDLYILNRNINKNYVEANTKDVYDYLINRCKYNICAIRNGNIADYNGKVAFIGINRSRVIPRFEVGVIKFIQLNADHLAKLESQKYISDFGHDHFEEDNFWIWVENGEIVLRSYRFAKHMPCVSKTFSCPQTDKYLLIMNNGVFNEKHTPFISDEDMMVNSILNHPFSSPARNIAEYF